MPTIVKRVSRSLGIVVSFLIVSFSISSTTTANDSLSDTAFEEHIRPVLASRCVKCHGPKKQEGGLRLDSREAILTGGETGPAIVPGEPESSLLVAAIRYEDIEMPPTEQLDSAHIDSISAWVRAGAKWPETGSIIRDTSASLTEEDRNWWAFLPREPVDVPRHENDSWSRNEIDRFVFQKLAENSMQPAIAAERRTLVRRLYFDVIGLPPTPEEVDAFLHDARPDAYERLVNELLEDSRHGEHWARFWLDLVRHAESDGWKQDAYRPNIWRYRDYVVNALNADKPYAEFVREQLAGDEIENASPEQLAATGFLRLGIFEYNQRDALKHWDDILNEITNVTGDVFLGMGMSCARCHDHKFDPIPQTDYFQLRAFFEPLIWRDDVPFATEERISRHAKQLAEWEAATREVREPMESLLAPYKNRKMKATIDKFSLEIQGHFRTPIEQQSSRDAQMAYLVSRQFSEEGASPLASMKGDAKKRYDNLQKQLAEFDAIKPPDLPTMMTVGNHDGECSATIVPGVNIEVKPGTLTVLEHIPCVVPTAQEARRTALADWICRPDNPLTTRVIVNRIWQQHFGTGLVRSPSDFGRLGQQPTHAKLLDWLTNDFVENGWTFKRLHKQILMSATWRQSATHPNASEYRTVDPAVTFLWQAPTRRLSAEQIRDATLVASGELRPEIGGPSVKGTVPRRSLYVQSFRNRPEPFLAEFDVAGGLNSVSSRNNTTTPIQALMMINGEFVMNRARSMAARCVAKHDSPADQIAYAMRLAWGRSPTESESLAAMNFLRTSSADDGAEEARSTSMIDFCHVLLNSNEFLYVD